jgi:hypothetical protein
MVKNMLLPRKADVCALGLPPLYLMAPRLPSGGRGILFHYLILEIGEQLFAGVHRLPHLFRVFIGYQGACHETHDNSKDHIRIFLSAIEWTSFWDISTLVLYSFVIKIASLFH